MSNNISHDGVVVKVEGRQVTVRFVQSSACSGCHAKQLCAAGDQKERLVVADSYGIPYAVGDAVTVSVTQGLARTAMWYAFGLPVLLVVAAIYPLNLCLGEIWACVAELAMVGIYYWVLYLFRDKLDHKVSFILTKRS